MKAPQLGPAGRDFWDRTLAAYGLTPAETVLLTQVCKRIDALADLDAAVAENGTMIPGSKGQLVVNPAVAEARGQCQILHRLLSALVLPDAAGNTIPTARSAAARASPTARWAPRTGPTRNAG